MDWANAERAPEDGFAKLFERIYDAAILIDADTGAIVEANAAALNVLGYSRNELQDLVASDIHPHEIPRFEWFVREVRKRGTWRSDELSCRTKTGDLIPSDVRATFVQVFGRRCILAVVSELRTQKLAALGQAVRKISHDLRNTLSTAQLLSDRLAESEDPETRRIAQTLTRSIDRAVGLCGETLAVGRVQERTPSLARFFLWDAFNDVIAAAGLEEAGLETAAEAPCDLEVQADYDQLFRILLNLVRNAAQAQGTSRVALHAWRARYGIVIDVVDDGPGLPAEVQKALSVKGTASATGASGASVRGTGLGLSIARELAQAHGGDLVLIATGEDGTRFRLHLPQA